MIDFTLSEEQQAIRETARQFAENEVKPIALARDQAADHKDCFQWDIVEKLSQVGFRTLTLDEKYGGPGVDSLTAAIVCEELAVGDLGVSAIVAQQAKFVQMMQWTLPDEVCRKHLIPFRDDRLVIISAPNHPLSKYQKIQILLGRELSSPERYKETDLKAHHF